jgi:hypothetical protein
MLVIFRMFLMIARFLELGSTLEPGKPVKADKAAILSDATRMVIQLRSEAQQLKDTNGSLEEKIKELKVTHLSSFLYYLGIHQHVFGKKNLFSCLEWTTIWLIFPIGVQ